MLSKVDSARLQACKYSQLSWPVARSSVDLADFARHFMAGGGVRPDGAVDVRVSIQGSVAGDSHSPDGKPGVRTSKGVVIGKKLKSNEICSSNRNNDKSN